MKIIFISKNGCKTEADFEEGQTILEVAQKNKVEISCNCEGFGVCGSCHVKIENLLEKMPPISDSENDTLDRVSGLSANSRLACQVVLNSTLDGLLVKIP